MSVQNPMQSAGPRPPGAAPAKRWYQRWWVWVLVGVIVLVVLPMGACTAAVGGLLAIGAASGGSGVSSSTSAPMSTAPPTPGATPSPSASPSPSPSPSETAEESALIAVPNVVGMPGDEARDALEEAGFEVNWTNETVFAASNWVVITQSATEAEEGAEIGLQVARPEATATPTPPAAPAAPGPVDSTAARVACGEYGEQIYPYGFDMHSFIGVYADEQRGDQWFYKVDVTITNAYGAEYEAVLDCFVGGTEDAPVVQEFLVY